MLSPLRSVTRWFVPAIGGVALMASTSATADARDQDPIYTGTQSPSGMTRESPTLDTSVPTMGSGLYVGQQNAFIGQTVYLAALLVNADGDNAGKQVRIQVKQGSTTVLSRYVATDAKGRVITPFDVPQLGAPVSYTVTATWAGDATHAPASDTETMPVGPPGPLGHVDPGNVRITGYATRIAAGIPNTVRVHFAASTLPRGRVSYWLQGQQIGSAVVDGSGMSRFSWTPSAAQIRTMNQTGKGEHAGAIQAWFEPGRGAGLSGAAAIFPLHATAGTTTCDRYRTPNDCVATPANGVQTSVVRRGRIRVFRDDPTGGRVITTPKISTRFDVPPEPEPKPWCMENLLPSSMAGTCDRTCEYVEVAAFADDGNLQRVVRDSGALGCDRSQAIELDVTDRDLRIAHDICRLQATVDRRSTWNVDLDGILTHQVSGLFRFRDPHAWRDNGAWKVEIETDLFAEDATVTYPVTIECR